MDISQEEIKERIEHRDAILNIRAVLATRPGKEFFKYLFKALAVGELPELGIEGTYLAERIGFLRAGNSIFKLTAEANFELAGLLLAEIEKDRYDELYKETKNG
jgi:hypothetical protein